MFVSISVFILIALYNWHKMPLYLLSRNHVSNACHVFGFLYLTNIRNFVKLSLLDLVDRTCGIIYLLVFFLCTSILGIASTFAK